MSESLLIVRSATELCALPLHAVIEVMRPLPTVAVHGAPPSVIGMARVRGAPVPVVCLSRLLGDPPPEAPGRFVVVDAGAGSVVLAVAEVIGVDRAAAAALAELPGLLRRARPDVVTAMASLDHRFLLLLDAGRILAPGFAFAPPGAA